MSIYIIIGIIIVLLIAMAVNANLMRKRKAKDNSRRYVSRYILRRLTQHAFTKAVNITMDLVTRDGAEIEVIYDNQVILNGYIDIDEKGNDRPYFWYNKKVLDKHNIAY